jgi:hypothetical protein
MFSKNNCKKFKNIINNYKNYTEISKLKKNILIIRKIINKENI